MKKIFILSLFLTSIFISGCATGPVGPAKKAGITTVQVEPRVNSEAIRFGMIAEGSLNAALTGLILDSIKSKQLTEMTTLMHDNGIDVPQMVRERFTLALKDSGLVLDTNKADATFVLALHQHGFDDAGFSLSKKIPFVWLDAQLQDHQGNRIWRRQAGNNVMSTKGVGATWTEYKADPDRLRRDWEAQIDFVVRAVLGLK